VFLVVEDLVPRPEGGEAGLRIDECRPILGNSCLECGASEECPNRRLGPRVVVGREFPAPGPLGREVGVGWSGVVSHSDSMDVVRRPERLIRLRNRHSAFNGKFRVLDLADCRLRLAWFSAGERYVLDVVSASKESSVESVDSLGHVERVRL
jgi:hypothetical protein